MPIFNSKISSSKARLKLSALSLFLATTTILSPSTFAAAEAEVSESLCPAALVSFWKKFAISTHSPEAVPSFLIDNNCIKTTSTSDFYHSVEQRLSQPQNAALVDELYALLNEKPSTEK